MAEKVKIQPLITSLSEEYTLGAIESVKRNSHMNNLQGDEVITTDDVKKVISGIIEQVNSSDCSKIVSRIDLLEHLRTIITSIRKSFGDMDQKIADAILVDFTNFVGVSQGGNYGLRTKDIIKKKPIKKQKNKKK